MWIKAPLPLDIIACDTFSKSRSCLEWCISGKQQEWYQIINWIEVEWVFENFENQVHEVCFVLFVYCWSYSSKHLIHVSWLWLVLGLHEDDENNCKCCKFYTFVLHLMYSNGCWKCIMKSRPSIGVAPVVSTLWMDQPSVHPHRSQNPHPEHWLHTQVRTRKLTPSLTKQGWWSYNAIHDKKGGYLSSRRSHRKYQRWY